MLRPSLSRRDAFLVLIGASSMHLWSLLLGSVSSPSGDEVELSGVPHPSHINHLTDIHQAVQTQTVTATTTLIQPPVQTQADSSSESWNYGTVDEKTHIDSVLPPSTLLAHAPGWTLVRNLYMANDTLYIVTPESPSTPPISESSRHRQPHYYGPKGEDLTYGYTQTKGWPEIRLMTSTGLDAVNSPENIASREPLPRNMQFITVKEARRRWGDVAMTDEHGAVRQESRVWEVKGNSLLFNDPAQFLGHYYHFVAELFLGVQAFWNSAFATASKSSDALAYHFSTSHSTEPPPIHRAIFMHSKADGWRDRPGFNSYFLRAAFPSLTVEHQEDWQDRVKASIEGVADGTSGERVWRFPVALLTDRSAAHRGVICGSQTQRTAAEAWDYMRKAGKLRGIHVGGWWAPVREAVWRFAGVNLEGGVLDGEQVSISVDSTKKDELKRGSAALNVVDIGEEYQVALPMPSEVVITYISRQISRGRKLVKEDHALMVQELNDLVKRKNEERKAILAKVKKEEALQAKKLGSESKGSSTTTVPPPWSFDVVEAEHLTKDQQVQTAARTTIMLGVHGNGLTHLVWMKPTRVSSVIEIFCPPGFAHDYWWTTRSLGMRHWAMWNDTSKTWPEKPNIDYPECFQGDSIPVYGPAVAKLIEDRVEGRV